jgi:uncharacterized protein YciI
VVVGTEPASFEAVRGAAEARAEVGGGEAGGAQALLNHGRYLQEQMTKGALQLAGPFLDDSGGLILYNARDEAEARAIAKHDPGVVDRILAVESIRPFHLAFDAASGKSPFSAAK